MFLFYYFVVCFKPFSKYKNSKKKVLKFCILLLVIILYLIFIKMYFCIFYLFLFCFTGSIIADHLSL